MESSTLIFYLGGFLLVLDLYGTKVFLFHFIRSRGVLLASFLVITMAAVPVAWLISPDWQNPNVREIANWIGTPLILLTVPTISFLYDYYRGAANLGSAWYCRSLVEVFIGVPAWGLLWVALEIFVLRWSSLS